MILNDIRLIYQPL